MCRVFSCVVGRGCLLWPVCSLLKTWLTFALLHSLFQGQICLLLQVSWLTTFAFQSPIMKRRCFWVLVLESLVCLFRTVQLQVLQYYWLGHRLELPWCWMVCLGKEQRSFCGLYNPYIISPIVIFLPDNSPLFLHSFVLLRSLITENCSRASTVWPTLNHRMA